MSFFPCSACGEIRPGKLATVYWAWFRVDGERVAHKQRLCTTCYVMGVAQVEVACEDEPNHCVACHTSLGDDVDATYATVFVPGRGPKELHLGACSACAVQIRSWSLQGALTLPDRQVEGLKASPSTSATATWQALGLRP